MAKARVTTSHTYNEGDAEEIAHAIFNEYAALLGQLDRRLAKEKTILGNNELF